MYKYCCFIALSISTLCASEFVNGVTIKDPKVSMLFATAESLYVEDATIRAHIDELYTEYLSWIESRNTNAPLASAKILAEIEMLIASKK